MSKFKELDIVSLKSHLINVSNMIQFCDGFQRRKTELSFFSCEIAGWGRWFIHKANSSISIHWGKQNMIFWSRNMQGYLLAIIYLLQSF